jgi:hypothetical protein
MERLLISAIKETLQPTTIEPEIVQRFALFKGFYDWKTYRIAGIAKGSLEFEGQFVSSFVFTQEEGIAPDEVNAPEWLGGFPAYTWPTYVVPEYAPAPGGRAKAPSFELCMRLSEHLPDWVFLAATIPTKGGYIPVVFRHGDVLYFETPEVPDVIEAGSLDGKSVSPDDAKGEEKPIEPDQETSNFASNASSEQLTAQEIGAIV